MDHEATTAAHVRNVDQAVARAATDETLARLIADPATHPDYREALLAEQTFRANEVARQDAVARESR